MGVPGLWKLLDSAKCPIEFEQLSGKVIAIDMNIWLHQALKSRASNDYQGAYLAILFRRICKLLYFGIRPVFVFDGEVPALKKSTMVTRRQLRRQLGSRAEKAEQRLIRRLLHRIAEGAAVDNTDLNGPSSLAGPSNQHQGSKAKAELLHRLSRREEVVQAKEDAQLFNIPDKLEDNEFAQTGDLLHECAGLEFDDLARDYLDSVDLYSPTASLDLHSEAFCALPLKAQMRVVQMARDRLDSTYRHQGRPTRALYSSVECDENSTDAEMFSTGQMNRLLLRHQLSERQQELSSQLTTEEAANQLNEQLTRDGSPDAQQRQNWASILRSQIDDWAQSAGLSTADYSPVTSALKIQSRSTGHAILVKRVPVKANLSVTQPANFGQVISLESLIRSSSGDILDTPTMENENRDVSAVLQQHQQPDKVSLSPGSPLSAVATIGYPDDVVAEPVSFQTVTAGSDDDGGDKSTLLNINNRTPGTFSPSVDYPTRSSPSSLLVSPSTDLLHQQPPIVTQCLANQRVTSPMSESLHDMSAEQEEDEFIDVAENEQQLERSEPIEEIISSSDSDSSCDLLSVVTTDSENNEDTPVPVDEPEIKPSADEMLTSVEGRKQVEDDDDVFQLDDAVLREEADRLTRQAKTTTTRYIEEAQDLLRLFGLPFVVSPEEAEAQCVSLQLVGLVDLVASDDSDVWPFGAHAVCRHLFGGSGGGAHGAGDRSKPQQRDTVSPCRYTVNEFRNKLGLSPANLLCLALLCGSDYTTGIPNVGPVTAVEILSVFGTSASGDECDAGDARQWNVTRDNKTLEATVDSVLAPLCRFVDWWRTTSELAKVGKSDVPSFQRNWLKLYPPRGFPDRQVIRAYLQPNVTRQTAPFVWKSPDMPGLIKHAASRLGWRPETTDAMLSAVLKRHQLRLNSRGLRTATTALITDYYGPQEDKEKQSKEDSTEPLSVQSKRLRLAANRLRQKNKLVPNDRCETATSNSNTDPLPAQYSQMPSQSRLRGPSRRGVRRGQRSTNPSTKKSNVSPSTSNIQVMKRSSRPRGTSRRRVVVERATVSEDDEESRSN